MEWGFKLNDNDKCVANKTINARQCTIIWHIDNIKISHLEKRVVDHIIDKLNIRFGEYSQLSTSTGNKLDYLGMMLDYTTKGKSHYQCMSTATKFILKSDMNRVSKTPTTGHLFNINPDAAKLPEDRAQLFHHLVAKFLYLCRCTRQDTQKAVAFLCTRVKEPDKDDYKKLMKVMQYIRNTKDLTLTIKPSTDPKWWVDSS